MIEAYELDNPRRTIGLIGLSCMKRPDSEHDCEILIGIHGPLAIATWHEIPESGETTVTVRFAQTDDEEWTDRFTSLNYIKKIEFSNGIGAFDFKYIGISYQELLQLVNKAFIDYAQYLVEEGLGLYNMF